MRTYWDSSALIEAVYVPSLMKRLQVERGITRPHSLAMTFSVLTGNPESRLAAEDASRAIQNLARHLEFGGPRMEIDFVREIPGCAN
jgi:hypothetical protein